MSESGSGPPKGPIAAAAVVALILGGGLFGAIALGSSPAIHFPASVAVPAATPSPGGPQAGLAALPVAQQPASPQLSPSPALQVIAPDRPVEVIRPEVEPSADPELYPDG
jgi:hypothetical protein